MSEIHENDETRDIARPAIIVAAIRSGGTFLSHCLSNHTQIFCDRSEPLHHRSVWYQGMNPDRQNLLAALLNQTGYLVSMCKLTYIQALEANVMKWLVAKQPMVIWLYRENLLRQAISVHLNWVARRDGMDHPQHSFRYSKPVKIDVDPGLFLKYMRGLNEQNERMKAALVQYKQVYVLTYADVVGGEGKTTYLLPPKTADDLCKFLGVRSECLSCDLRPINPYPLRELIGNWTEVERAVKASPFADQLEKDPTWLS